MSGLFSPFWACQDTCQDVIQAVQELRVQGPEGEMRGTKASSFRNAPAERMDEQPLHVVQHKGLGEKHILTPF